MEKITLHDIKSKGIAIGEAFLLIKEQPCDNFRLISEIEKKPEEVKFSEALQETCRQISEMATMDSIFAAHLEIARDEMLNDLVFSKINLENKCAEWSLTEAGDEMYTLLGGIEDGYLRERAADVRDVVNRIRQNLKGKVNNPFSKICKEMIIVAEELFPSDTVLMDFGKVQGFITRQGGMTSHVAIIAQNRGIPALMGIGDDFLKLSQGTLLILDGENGEIYIDPDSQTLKDYMARIETDLGKKSLLRSLKEQEAITFDGYPIHLMANVSDAEEVHFAIEQGASGIGLFRSELLFLKSREGFPDEETQFNEYRDAAETCINKPLIIRTLDIGGDKSLPYFAPAHEENPILGCRGIRISLAEPGIFRTQLRALLRASAFGNIRIMFPMIISLEEWNIAKGWVEKCKTELRNEGKVFNEKIDLGVMIETPAAVMIAEDLAVNTCFLSIGTNDLTQYTLAVDRMNAKVASLYDPFHPAVIRSIAMVLRAAGKHGTAVGMCGQLAGNPKAVRLLLGLGLKEFSIAPADIPEIKNLIRKTSMREARKLAKTISLKNTAAEIRQNLGIV